MKSENDVISHGLFIMIKGRTWMKWRLMIVVGLVLVLTACSSNKPRELGSNEVCQACNMGLTDVKYAAQLVMENGEQEVFDDIGCLMDYMMDMDSSKIGAAFVMDVSKEKWINAEKATYVYAETNWTPMNYGVIAFDSEKAAKKWVEEQEIGEILSYDDLHEFNWGVHNH